MIPTRVPRFMKKKRTGRLRGRGGAAMGELGYHDSTIVRHPPTLACGRAGVVATVGHGAGPERHPHRRGRAVAVRTDSRRFPRQLEGRRHLISESVHRKHAELVFYFRVYATHWWRQ